jgi:hypothetical protein
VERRRQRQMCIRDRDMVELEQLRNELLLNENYEYLYQIDKLIIDGVYLQLEKDKTGKYSEDSLIKFKIKKNLITKHLKNIKL